MGCRHQNKKENSDEKAIERQLILLHQLYASSRWSFIQANPPEAGAELIHVTALHENMNQSIVVKAQKEEEENNVQTEYVIDGVFKFTV